MYKTLFILLFLFPVLFWQCNGANKRNDGDLQDRTDSKTDSPIIADNNIEIIDSPGSSFNPEKFKILIDSFVPQITGNSTPFSCKSNDITDIDTLQLWDGLQPSKAIQIKRYDYDNNEYFLRIKIIEVTYNNSKDAGLVFENLKVLAKDSGAKDNTPGLTYTNDYLIKSNKKVFWLNAGCYYAYPNFVKLSRMMYSSIENIVKQDSVKCKCGGTCIE